MNQRFKVRFVMDNVDEQIDAVSRSVLALTVELRPLPRPQVRPDPDDRLLRPGRHLHQHRELRRRARTRWAAAGLDYYDPAMLVTLLQHTTSRAGPSARQVGELKAAVAKKAVGRHPRHRRRAWRTGPNG